MKLMSFVVYREEEFFVSQCLNMDVYSFGETREEAVTNLKEAVELYFVSEPESDSQPSPTSTWAKKW
jgi:predicted RNase H-like HicB family nuclease